MWEREDLLDKFEEYKKDYLSFNVQENHRHFASNIRNFDDYISLVYYAPLHKNTEKIFVIIPSIFNSPDILSIGRPSDIITRLRSLGSVFLIEWQEVQNPNAQISNYIESSNRLLSELASEYLQKIDLIGHCLGGNIALASNVLMGPEVINRLVLLSTPWDFSFLVEFRKVHQNLSLDNSVRDLENIPALYFQILFFLMNQSSFEEKIDYYIGCKENVDIGHFFAIEKWQFSGHPLPRALYIELMDDIIARNIMFNNMWKVGSDIIDPSVITNEVVIITGSRDMVVPVNASKILLNIIQQSRYFEYNTGHIGYLVGSQKEHFMLDLINLLKTG